MRKVKDEDKKNLFNDLNLRNSFTDEEGNFPSSKRLPFKSDGETGESDFERTQSQEKLPKGNFSYGVDFKTPGSSKNVINIIDKFEIKEDGGNTGQPEIKRKQISIELALIKLSSTYDESLTSTKVSEEHRKKTRAARGD